MVSSFKKLNAWKEAKSVAVKVFNISKEFPKEEIYGFTSQIRRAAFSISNNISEGYGYRYIDKRINQFDTAVGSTNEVENMIDIGYELGFIKKKDHDGINDSLENTRKLLFGLIRSLETQKENNKSK